MENKGDSMGNDSTITGGASSKKPIVEAVKDASSVKYVSEKLGVSRPTLYKYMEKYDAGDEAGPSEQRRLDAQEFFDFLQEADRTEEEVVLYFHRLGLDPDGAPSKTLKEIDEESIRKQSEWYKVDDRLYELGNDLADAMLGWQGSSEHMKEVAGRVREIDAKLKDPSNREAIDWEEYLSLDEEHWELCNEITGVVLSSEGAPDSLRDVAVRHERLNAKLLSLQESTPEEIRQAEEAKMYHYKEHYFDRPAKRKQSEDVGSAGTKLPDPAVVSSSGRAMIMFPDVASEDVVARVLADFGGTRKPIAEYRPAPGTRFVTVEGLVSGITFYCEVADLSAGVSSGQVPFSL